MTDKEKIREEIEKLKSQLLRGACSSQIAMETRCKEEAYNEVLALLDSLQEEPVNDDLEIEIKHCIYEPFFDLDGVAIKGATKYLTVEDIADIARYFANWQKRQDQETIELAEDHAMLAGMNKMEQQMKAKAIDAHCFGFQGAALFSFKLPTDNYLVGSEVKVIVIKEN